MSGKTQRWHDDAVDRAVRILNGHDALEPAIAAVAKALGFAVTRASLDFAIKRAGKGTAFQHLRKSRAWSSPEPEIPVDVDEEWDDKTDPQIELPPEEHAPPHRFATPAEAASRGWAPAHDWTHAVPEGHRIKGNSTLYGHDGEVDAQWVKSERDSNDPPAYEPVPEGHLVKKVSSLVDGQGKVRAQWIQAPKDEQTQWDQFWAACERNAKQYKGIAEPTERPAQNDAATCTIYPLGDPHIGMLAWAPETGQDFDLAIAARELTRAIDLLVDRAPSSATAVLANVGDFFHAEGDDQRTPTAGNKLDCDTRHAKITDVGFTLMRHLIDRLLTKHASVSVVNVPGNHDPRMARMMNMWLAAVYEREPRVRVEDNRNPYIYLRHGKNLIGFAHGDGAKTEQLPGIMAADRAEDWGSSEYRVWFTGHIHHQTKKEYPGCTIESFRTLAARDYWHSWKGYRSGQSLSCITLHEEYGEITRSTVDIKLVRAAA